MSQATPLAKIQPEPGSFRDPDSQVYRLGERILRQLSEAGAGEYHALDASGLMDDLVNAGLLVPSSPLGADEIRELGDGWSLDSVVLEHPRLPFISYVYEWPFGMLKAAALLHLDILRAALARDFVVKDSTTYNIQFRGTSPIFIDIGSFERYAPDAPWKGYAQFCSMFLNPLLLEARTGLSFQSWLRSSLEGIRPEDLSRVLSLRHKLGRGVFIHVMVQLWLNRRFAGSRPAQRLATTQSVQKKHILGTVAGLRRLIAGLRTKQPGSEWTDYQQQNTYGPEDRRLKEHFVEQAVSESRPRMVWDLGCNTGAYSRIAARHAQWVIAMDSDPAAVNALFRELGGQSSNITPLVMNVLNPSPDQGWSQLERPGLERRGPADFVLCLALVHHLAITGNVPLDRLFDWLARITQAGVVEFVPKTDPMVTELLRWRTDVYNGYQQSSFEAAMGAHFQVLQRAMLPNGRTLYRFTRGG